MNLPHITPGCVSHSCSTPAYPLCTICPLFPTLLCDCGFLFHLFLRSNVCLPYGTFAVPPVSPSPSGAPHLHHSLAAATLNQLSTAPSTSPSRPWSPVPLVPEHIHNPRVFILLYSEVSCHRRRKRLQEESIKIAVALISASTGFNFLRQQHVAGTLLQVSFDLEVSPAAENK